MTATTQDKLDHLSMVCANPSDHLSAGLWCETANEAYMLARSLFEQFESLENAARSIAYLNDDGLCWCDDWYHDQDPITGEQRDVTEHQEACRRLRGLVSNPSSGGES